MGGFEPLFWVDQVLVHTNSQGWWCEYVKGMLVLIGRSKLYLRTQSVFRWRWSVYEVILSRLSKWIPRGMTETTSFHSLIQSWMEMKHEIWNLRSGRRENSNTDHSAFQKVSQQNICAMNIKKRKMIAMWNVRSFFTAGKLANVTLEMENLKTHVQWSRRGKCRLNCETLLYRQEWNTSLSWCDLSDKDWHENLTEIWYYNFSRINK